mgnify:FL=1|jgi:hypothetical protein|tara:strand:- start:719 stop:925 length:207 start_codon:yes stop_codon:yes gene_type:complete
MGNVIKIEADAYVTPSAKDPKKKIPYKQRLQEIDQKKAKENIEKVVKKVFNKKKKFGHTDLTKDGLFR